jgi:type IV secretory pathway VirB2 component (pilin)
MRISDRGWTRTWLLMGLLFVATQLAWAGGAGGGGLPWETPLNRVAQSMTGPVALSISLIALMVAGGTLVFGGELSEFARRSCVAVLAIAFLVLGAGFMTTLFGVGGAVVL